MKRWVPVLLVGSTLTPVRPIWGTPRASFKVAYRWARWTAWFADHFDPRYASEELSIGWAVVDRTTLDEETRGLLDRMHGPTGGELALAGPWAPARSSNLSGSA